jgi:hypothetical protein
MRIGFFPDFFWNFFGSREVHGTDDFDLRFGFIEWKSRAHRGSASDDQCIGPTDTHSLTGSNPTTGANAGD